MGRHGDGTAAAKRIGRAPWNDPATGVMRHADAGYEIALAVAREKGWNCRGFYGLRISRPGDLVVELRKEEQ